MLPQCSAGTRPGTRPTSHRGAAEVLLGQRLREVGVDGACELHEAPVHAQHHEQASGGRARDL